MVAFLLLNTAALELFLGVFPRVLTRLTSFPVFNHGFFLGRALVKYLSPFSKPVDPFLCYFVEPFPSVFYQRRVFDSSSKLGVLTRIDIGRLVPLLWLRGFAVVPTRQVALVVATARCVTTSPNTFMARLPTIRGIG